MKLGRIDRETTVNIGVISGGEAINIIPPLVQVKGEIRSHNPEKIKKEKNAIKNCILKAIKNKSIKIYGEIYKPHFEFSSLQKFPEFNIDENNKLVKIIEKCLNEMGLKMKKSISGGGTDANIFYANRIITPILSTGMKKVHTTEEYLDLDNFFNSAILTLKIISNLSNDIK